MDEGALHKISYKYGIRDGLQSLACRFCGGSYKTCYRYYHRPLDKMIYLILPCHQCHLVEWKHEVETKKYPRPEYSERWVNLPLELQLESRTPAVTEEAPTEGLDDESDDD